mmetsp:Transcript_17906/g.35991  ORF Transcript_17906/g.35991 Transcript_17906/m.35991 type:complete len:379 (-) Transcript_17906:762-1898(-)
MGDFRAGLKKTGLRDGRESWAVKPGDTADIHAQMEAEAAKEASSNVPTTGASKAKALFEKKAKEAESGALDAPTTQTPPKPAAAAPKPDVTTSKDGDLAAKLAARRQWEDGSSNAPSKPGTEAKPIKPQGGMDSEDLAKKLAERRQWEDSSASESKAASASSSSAAAPKSTPDKPPPKPSLSSAVGCSPPAEDLQAKLAARRAWEDGAKQSADQNKDSKPAAAPAPAPAPPAPAPAAPAPAPAPAAPEKASPLVSKPATEGGPVPASGKSVMDKPPAEDLQAKLAARRKWEGGGEEASAPAAAPAPAPAPAAPPPRCRSCRCRSHPCISTCHPPPSTPRATNHPHTPPARTSTCPLPHRTTRPPRPRSAREGIQASRR